MNKPFFLTQKILAIYSLIFLSNIFYLNHSWSADKELKIGISQEFENLNPIIKQMAATSYIFNFVGRSLDTMDENSNWIPLLAKEIPSLENKKANITTVKGIKKIIADWEILENASWGDGKPVTCEDFAFTAKVASNPLVATPEKEIYTQIENIDWDPKTPKKCRFTFSKVTWDFFKLGSFYPIPKHLEEPIFKEYGNQVQGYERNTNFVKNPTLPGLYCGPYVVSQVKMGSFISFKSNPYFYGKKPSIEKIIVKYIPNTGTLEANLRSGTIDMIAPLGLDMDQALSFEKQVKSSNLPYIVHFVPGLTYEHIDLNLDNPILKDVRVRKALLYGINRDEMVQSLFQGKEKTAHHLFSPKDNWYSEDPALVTIYQYSKKEAIKLLESAGWKLGTDGYRTKDGKRLSLDLITTSGNKTRELVQVYLQQQWKQIGIEVILKNQPARVFFSETTKKRGFEAMALFAWISSPETNPRSSVHSKSIPSSKNSWSGQNTFGWSNKKVDESSERLDIEFNPQKRKLIAQQIIKSYTEEVPALPLYYKLDISVTPKRLKNYQMTGHQFFETNKVEFWDLE